MSAIGKYQTTPKTLGLEGVNFRGLEFDNIFTPGANLADMPITTWELFMFHINHAILTAAHSTYDFWNQIQGDVNHAATSTLLWARTWSLWVMAFVAPVTGNRHPQRLDSDSSSFGSTDSSSRSSRRRRRPAQTWTDQIRSWFTQMVVSLSRRLPLASRHLSWLYASASSDLGVHLGLLEQQKSPLLIKREVAKLGTVPSNVGFVLEMQPLLEAPPDMQLPQPLFLATGDVVNPSQEEVDRAQGEIDAYRVKMAVHGDREQARIKQSIANIVVWCSVVGIKRVSVYEDTGALLRDHDALWEVIQRQLVAYYGCSATNCGSRPDFVSIHSPVLNLSTKFDNDVEGHRTTHLSSKGGSGSAPPPTSTSTPLSSPKPQDILSAPLGELVETWGVDLTLLSGKDSMTKASNIGNFWLSQSGTVAATVDTETIHQSLLELTRGPIELLYVATLPYCTVRRFPKASIYDAVIVYDDRRCTFSEFVTGSPDETSVLRRCLQNVFGNPSKEQDEGGMLFEFFYRGLEAYAGCLSSEFKSMNRRRRARQHDSGRRSGSRRWSRRQGSGRRRKGRAGEDDKDTLSAASMETKGKAPL